jgi:hypothetical protein
MPTCALRRMWAPSRLDRPTTAIHPFAINDRVAPMEIELVDRMATLVVVRRFLGMGVADSRSFRPDIYVRINEFFVGLLPLASVDF